LGSTFNIIRSHERQHSIRAFFQTTFMSNNLPGAGLFGWLGRQIGYVKKAVKSDPAGAKKVYRNESVEEQVLPSDPKVKLRRTTIDEVIVAPTASNPTTSAHRADQHDDTHGE